MYRGSITLRFAADTPAAQVAATPRTDVLDESVDTDAPGRFVQHQGPFAAYERTLRHDDATGETVEQTTYELDIPYFTWVYRRLLHRALMQRSEGGSGRAWWSPSERLDARQVRLLGLLAGAGLIAAFTNTLFTQTVAKAADTFNIGEQGQGNAGSIVRLGAIIVIPFAMFADRVGRRRVLVMMAWAAPGVCALGAFAPTFSVLTATQAIGRPLGLALSVMIGVMLAEEMPSGARAFALSVVTMAAGLGATVAVAPLFLDDVVEQGWRIIYLLALGFWAIARRLSRELPETHRFEVRHDRDVEVHRTVEVAAAAPATPRRVFIKRFMIIATVAVLSNVFVAPASFFQNRYLEDVRGLSDAQVSMFTIITATPAGIGLLIGGKLAERGRRILVITFMPISCLLIVATFGTGGALMWLAALFGGIFGAMAYPALVVYRGEMFATGSRGGINGVLTFLSLLGGVVGLLTTGHLVDNAGWSYGRVMLLLGCGQLIAALVVYLAYPETARMELEALNPEDAGLTAAPTPTR